MRVEGKIRLASRVGALPCLLALAAAMPLVPTQAQDSTASEPAPVLRGFRLDPDQAKPQPPPPTATVVPPTETPTPSTEQPRPSAQPRTKSGEPRTRQVQPASAPDQGKAQSNESAVTPVPDAVPDVPAASPPAPETNTAGPVTEPTRDSGDNSLWWQLSAAGIAFGFVLAGLWWLRRQPRRESKRDAVEEIANVPAIPVPVKPVQSAPVPTAPIAKPVARKAEAVAPILLEFLPDRAVVSVSNLSVTGKLRMTNRSDKPVEQLRLRAALIGASANQAEIISAFHNREDGSEKALADLKPGEKRSFAIDMALPLADIPSYVVGSQRLLVPIVMANLAYGKGRTAQVELACIVGREANPPQPKLGPLRLDLGPRSFAPLGQRLLAA